MASGSRERKQQRPAEGKQRVTVVVVGHVDAGKSTLTGHLLYLCGGVKKRAVERFERETSRSAGRRDASFKYAWLLDKLKAERERGISIDVSEWRFDSRRFHFNVLDAPGHRDFLKNMISGACKADVAVLVVDASVGGMEAGLAPGGQAREHAMLVRILGISQVVVAVNKMDAPSVRFVHKRFQEVVQETSKVLWEVGFEPACITFVPISGRQGENMVAPSTSMPWFMGPTLLEALDALDPPPRPAQRPLRVPVRDVYRISGLTVPMGRVAAGTLETGATVQFAPGSGSGEVVSVLKRGVSLPSAGPGDKVGFGVAGLPVAAACRGAVAGPAGQERPRAVRAFEAHVVMLLRGGGTIRQGYSPVVECHAANVACRFDALIRTVDPLTGEPLKVAPTALKAGDAAVVRLVPMRPMCVEPFAESPVLGRVVIRDMNSVVAVGVVRSVDH